MFLEFFQDSLSRITTISIGRTSTSFPQNLPNRLYNVLARLTYSAILPFCVNLLDYLLIIFYMFLERKQSMKSSKKVMRQRKIL
jgi:hypothetical protein